MGARRGIGPGRVREGAGGCYVTVKRGLSQEGGQEAKQEANEKQEAKRDWQGAKRAATRKKASTISSGQESREPGQAGSSMETAGAMPKAGGRLMPEEGGGGLFPKRLDFSLIDKEFSKAGRPALGLDGEWAGRGFSLPMPPPNITGKLHLGHALDLGLQDALIRRAASRGAKTSWIAGCDHAGQATHEKIMLRWPDLSWSTPEEQADYWAKAEIYALEARAGIMGQFEALHPLADLSDPRFTLDPGYQETAGAALDKLIAMGRIRREGESLTLDLRSEARQLIAAIEGGEILIEPAAHAGRLLSMLREERLWEIGRSFPWGFKADLGFDEEGRAIGRGGPEWTLDTWFTSSLWPMAIGGGRPFDALIIGYDIAYFWGARMAMMNKALGGPWPFGKMMLHGLIRDGQGRKFSKSLGNGIDPMTIIGERGSDALRLWCCSKAAWGMDFKLNPAEMAAGGRWLTKMANACRLLEMRMPLREQAFAELGGDGSGEGGLDPRESWPAGFLSRALAFEEAFEAEMDSMRLDRACLSLMAFSRESWCEGWLSEAAPSWEGDPKGWLGALWGQRRLLALAHPFAPATTWWLSTRLIELERAFWGRARLS